jgi:hypothetical protein
VAVRFHRVPAARLAELTEFAAFPEVPAATGLSDAWFAYLLGYLNDESILVEVEDELAEDLHSPRGHLFSLFAPGQNPQVSEGDLSARLAEDEIQNPDALPALKEGLDLLQAALAAIEPDELLLVYFAYGP